MPRRVRLVIFDLDGVLVEERSSWGYLHSVLGSKGVVEERGYSKLFERGLISYSQWMELDLRAMIEVRGVVYCRELEEAARRVRIARGAREVVDLLRKVGVPVAIVSAGVDFIASRVAEELGIGEVHVNRLLCDSEGRLLPVGIEVVNPLRKGDVVRALARKYGVDLAETMYVGDSVWDCSAFSVVGVPVVVGSRDVSCGNQPGLELIYVDSLLELYEKLVVGELVAVGVHTL